MRTTETQWPRSLTAVAAFIPLVVTCATGCTHESGSAWEDELAIGEQRSPIVDGYLDEEDTHAIAIVYRNGDLTGNCSGTLITPSIILTARHCVAGDTAIGAEIECGAVSYTAPYPPADILVTTETTMPSSRDEYLAVAEVFVPMSSDAFCGADIALLRLADPIPAEVASPAVPRVDEEPEVGEVYSAIGHGARTFMGEAEFTRYRRDDLLITWIGASPLDPTIVDDEWMGETGLCRGDSGGGAHDLAGRVFGVASRVSLGCNSPIYSNVSSWADWIKETVADAVSQSGGSPPPWTQGYPTDPAFSFPVGATCTLPEDCPSNLCLDGICTRPCIDEAPCPEGYACNAEVQLCEAPPESESEPPPATSPDEAEVTGGCSLGDAPPRRRPWIPLLAAWALLTAIRRRHQVGLRPAKP